MASLEAAVDAWISAHHPKVLRGITKVVTKQNKQGKKTESTVTEPDPLQKFLHEHVGNGTIELLTTGRILFPLTRHESLCTLQQLEGYLNGKAYKRALVTHDNDNVDWSKYEPHIIAHRTQPNLLFCNLTTKNLNKKRSEVEAHINGASYQRAINAINEYEAKVQAKKDKLRAQRQARRQLLDNTFNTVGTSDDKYDFSNMDFGAMFEDDGEGEFDAFDFGEGEFDYDGMDFDEDLEFEEDEDEEEEEVVPVPAPVKGKKVTADVTPAIQVLDLSKKKGAQNVVATPAAAKSTKTAPVVQNTKKAQIPVPMVDSEDDDEDDEIEYDEFDDEDDEFPFDGYDGMEGEEGMSGMIDSEGEFIPGIYDGEGEFVPGVFSPNGHFVSFEDMADMMDGEGEFDPEAFFDDEDEDDDEDMDVAVYDEDGNGFDSDEDFDFDDEDEEMIDDDDDDQELDDSSNQLLQSFAMLRKKREAEAQKNAKALPKGKAAVAPPAPTTKRKAEVQIQPTKGKPAPPATKKQPEPTPPVKGGKKDNKMVQLSPAKPAVAAPKGGKKAAPVPTPPKGKQPNKRR